MDHYLASISDHEELARSLQTSTSYGLSALEARERLEKYGPNRLQDECEQVAQRHILQNVVKFLKQFADPLIQLLVICTIVSAVIGEYESAISVTISILIVSVISFVQNRRADKSLEKLNQNSAQMCEVVRENHTLKIEAQQLVPGDILTLSEGQRVPADVRLFDVNSLSIDESNLTGETQSQLKSAAPNPRIRSSLLPVAEKLDDHDIVQIEKDKNSVSKNLALMGTLIETGNGRGIVICTGKSTRFGEVFGMLKSMTHSKGPLQLNVDQLSIPLVVASCSAVALLSIVGLVQQRPIFEVAHYALALAVAAIPEGLPVAVAVILAEVTDVIVADNDLSVLVAAVTEGKGIHLKIQKFMTYQISISLTLLILTAVAFVLRTSTPFTVLQLLFINLLADGPPALSLGAERVQRSDLRKCQNDVGEPLLSCRLFGTIICMTAILVATNGLLYFALIDQDGALDTNDRAMLFTCFVFCSIFSLISSRSKVKTVFGMSVCSNKELLWCCAIVAVTQVCLVQIDPINRLFEVESIGRMDFVYLFLYSATVLVVMDTLKVLCRLCRVSSLKRCLEYFKTRELKFDN